jgi:serine/threonine-protein kinase
MLSAKDPFGLSIKGEQISEPSWLLAHSYEPPLPLRAQPGCEQLPLELEAAVIRCLQKKPSNRFASVSELAQALEAAIKPASNTGTLKSTTIVQPRPQQSPAGSHNETVPRPIQSSNDETVDRPSQVIPQQGSNHETINKPLQPQQGSNDETINKPLQPSPTQSVAQFFQPPSVSNSPGQQAPDGTIMQQPSTPGQQAPDGTIMQRPSTPGQQAPQLQLEGTILQPRVPDSEQKSTPDKTLFQPRPGTNSGNQETIDKTIMQQHRPGNNQTSENTIYQPKPSANQTPQQAPDGTIYQPRKEKPASNNLGKNLKFIALTLALALIVGFISFWLASRLSQNNRQAPTSVIPTSKS